MGRFIPQSHLHRQYHDNQGASPPPPPLVWPSLSGLRIFIFPSDLYKMDMHKNSCKGNCNVLPAHQCPICHNDCMGFWSVPLVMRRDMALYICYLFCPIATYLLYFRRKVTAASMVWNERVALPAGRSIRSSWNEWDKFSFICANRDTLRQKNFLLLLTLTPPGTTLPRRCSSVSGTPAARFPMTSRVDFPPTTAGLAIVGDDETSFGGPYAAWAAPLMDNPFGVRLPVVLVLFGWCRFLSEACSWDGRRLVFPLGTGLLDALEPPLSVHRQKTPLTYYFSPVQFWRQYHLV
jgi:hypothetical protein